MRHLLLTVAAVTTLGLASPAAAQGVPTFDGSQLGQLVAQLELFPLGRPLQQPGQGAAVRPRKPGPSGAPGGALQVAGDQHTGFARQGPGHRRQVRESASR